MKKMITAAGVVVMAGLGLAAPAGAAEADPGLVHHLEFMVEEERLAHDLYTLFAEQYPDARIFERIAASEQQHTAAVARQLDVRGLDNPGESLGAGDYAFDELDALYATWSAQGLESLEAALQVGVDLETADIADLEAALADPSTAPVERVFSALLAGSENHLAAFSSAVENGTPDMTQGMNRQGKGRGA